MNDTLLILLGNICSVSAVVGAIILALNNIEGWGWFLLIAVLTFTTYSSS